jgi:AcrR family transcriptional regulator
VTATSRARPLPPDERRAALVAATARLVRAHGSSVSTRQIADASGVAEGTIFRVFPDKESLVRAAVEEAMDCRPMLAELAGVDRTLPVRPRLIAVATILQRWLTDMISLLMAVQVKGPVGGRRAHEEVDQQIHTVVRGLLEADRDAFRVPLTEVTRLLRLIMFAGSHPMIAEGAVLTPDEIVSLLLDGVLLHQNGTDH